MKNQIYVETRISILGTKSLTMDHRLINRENGDVLSTCSAVLVCYDVKNMKSIKIPEHWRKSIIAHEGAQLIIK